MRDNFLFYSAIFAFLAVAMGAFGAHGLKPILSEYQLTVFKTAVDYHFWHALGLGLIGLVQLHSNTNYLLWSGWLMASGIVLFSGSLYGLAIFNLKWLGMITPLGGLCFLAAWLCFAIYAYQLKTKV